LGFVSDFGFRYSNFPHFDEKCGLEGDAMKRFNAVKLFKEPLVHFLLLGAVLFTVHAWLNRDRLTEDNARPVRITAQEIEWLKQIWTRQWQRPPTDDELKGLVAEYLKEELLSREARALQLDQNDTIVRRRLAQKMEFLLQDTTRIVEPTETELRRIYEAHPERFQTSALVSFTHIYFNRDQRGESAAADASQALQELSKPGAPASAPELGDRFLLEYDVVGQDEQAVANLFGREFAQTVFTLEPGQWQGPVESGYGLHLVRVAERQGPRLRAFDEVRQQVLEDWHRDRQKTVDEQYFAGLLKKYEIVVDDGIKPLVGPLVVASEAKW
jgi:hypothetical protein